MFYICTKSVRSSYCRNAFTIQQRNRCFQGQKQPENCSIYANFLHFVWYGLTYPIGECAQAWDKLAHLESIQKTNIYPKCY